MKIDVEVTNSARLKNGFSTVSISIPEIGARDILDLNFEPLYRRFGEPSPAALDLVLVASIAYLLDKCSPRTKTEDYWTREFEVDFPVASVRAWQRSRGELQECLSFLTGDIWQVGFKEVVQPLYSPPRKVRRLSSAQRLTIPKAVSLFSGGLDSLGGILDYLSASEERIVLVGHHDATGPAGDQHRLFGVLNGVEAYAGRADPLTVRARPLPAILTQPGQVVATVGRESTLRSRSFLFLALGIYAAHALGEEVPLLVPENGFIAINIPLTTSRMGTCSTRTTHPHFLEQARRLTAKLGFGNQISNPFELKTKGEVLTECDDRETLLALAPLSVSCAHATRRARWVRRDARNCGYCVPCLVRRASLYRINADDGSQYGYDVCAGELDLRADVASDLRAMLTCLGEVRSKDDIEARVEMTGPLPADRFDLHVDVVARGLDEMRAMFQDKGTAQIRSWARVR